MENVHLPPSSILTLIVMHVSASAAVRTAYRTASFSCTALEMPLRWTITTRSRWTAHASGTDSLWTVKLRSQ